MKPEMNRRNFLQGLAGLGAASVASGCVSSGFGFGTGGTMHRYAAPKLPVVRIGIVGLGSRGFGGLNRFCKIPGAEVTAICDIFSSKIEKSVARLKELGRPAPKTYLGPDAWRRLCDDPNVDVVYNTTPWDLHVPVCVGAMKGGKHAFVEVPGCNTVDEAWELVETSEATRRNCMMLENCVYGEMELLKLNLVRLGVLGEIVHGEGAYVHDLRTLIGERVGEQSEYWRFGLNRDHNGNIYPTHGLVPLCLDMDVNRGDRFDYLVSLESNQVNLAHYLKAHPENPRSRETVKAGDMNQTLIRTVKGRTILLQHDVFSPRPYTRLQLLSGTKGVISDYPYRIGLEEKLGEGIHEWFDEKRAQEIWEKYRHPLIKTLGEISKKVGGHGGMDFTMDVRWIYCLQNGLPLDMDVYDLATTSAICELTEKSVRRKSAAMDVPDFTRGGWKTASSDGIGDVDLGKMGFDAKLATEAAGQISV